MFLHKNRLLPNVNSTLFRQLTRRKTNLSETDLNRSDIRNSNNWIIQPDIHLYAVMV